MKRLASALLALGLAACGSSAQPMAGDDGVSLFNGKDFSGWKVPEGDNGHWKVLSGVIDYDAQSESPAKDKGLWTEKEFGDFVVTVDWRIKETPYVNPRVKDVQPDGSNKTGPDGKEIDLALPDSDSGILLRGNAKYQVNIWCWPVGSGEVYGVRMDKTVAPEVRAGVTPKKKADKPIGEWNTFEITLKGDRLSVKLNGTTVIENALLPGIAAKGPLGLQHHGSMKDGKWTSPPALVQFRNIKVKAL
jgi:3-keto-disaccharide hydrolase